MAAFKSFVMPSELAKFELFDGECSKGCERRSINSSKELIDCYLNQTDGNKGAGQRALKLIFGRRRDIFESIDDEVTTSADERSICSPSQRDECKPKPSIRKLEAIMLRMQDDVDKSIVSI